MSFASLAAWRRLCGLLGCALMVLLLAALVDGMVAGGLKDPNLLDLLPGQSVKLSEQMPRGAERLEDIQLRISDPRISVRFEETFSGFWMGGVLWRAEARLAPNLPVGDYSVAVFHHNGTAAGPTQAFTLRVHPNARSIQAASGSLVMRFLGLSPYLFALYLLGLAVAPMAASFVLSRRIDQALRVEHMAEIYRSMASPEGQRIFFGLGKNHALTPDSLVEVLDERARGIVGSAKVIDITGEKAMALMQDGVNVRPGALARLPQAH